MTRVTSPPTQKGCKIENNGNESHLLINQELLADSSFQPAPIFVGKISALEFSDIELDPSK